MNFLLRPWTTPKLELTALDEIVGAIEVIVAIFVVAFIILSINDFMQQRRLRKLCK